MTSREAAIYQLKQLKGKPLKTKITHIITYFWVPIAAILAAIIFLISMIVHYANLKPTALSVCCLNTIADQTSVDGYLRQFAQDQGIDLEEFDVTARVDIAFFGTDAETDYQNAQVLAAMLMTGALDVMTADHATITGYSYQQAFIDLEELLTQEQMETLAPHFLYMDLSYLEEMETFSNEARQYPDPTKPEEMEQPVPIAIILQPDWEFASICYPYTYGYYAVGLVAGAQNAANAEAFLQYILEQEEN